MNCKKFIFENNSNVIEYQLLLLKHLEIKELL